MSDIQILLVIVVLFVVAIVLLAIRTRKTEIRDTRKAFAQLPVVTDIASLYLECGMPSFVYVRLDDGGQVVRTVSSFLPARVGNHLNIRRHVVYYDTEPGEDFMVIRKPTADEAWWVKQGKPSPENVYCVRYVLEFHLAPGNMPRSG